MEDIISMSPLHIQVLILSLAVFAIALSVYFSIDGFDSDPQAGTMGCDSSCSNGGYSKITGKPCCNSGNTSVDNDNKICVKLPDGTTQCHNSGATGDTKGYRTGSVSSWDGKAAGDAGRISARLGAGDTDLDISYRDSLGGIGGSGELIRGPLWHSSRNGSKATNWYDDHEKYKRKTVDELISDSKDNKDVPGIGDTSSETPKKDNCPTDDETLVNILDNRIKSCKKLMDRSFERPSEKDYDTGARKGYDSCNKFTSCDGNEEEENICEGFSPLL